MNKLLFLTVQKTNAYVYFKITSKPEIIYSMLFPEKHLTNYQPFSLNLAIFSETSYY